MDRYELTRELRNQLRDKRRELRYCRAACFWEEFSKLTVETVLIENQMKAIEIDLAITSIGNFLARYGAIPK